MSARRLRVVAVAMVVAVAALVPSCSLVGGSKGGYDVTAYFPEAIALYSHSKVKVMGLDAGTVTSVKIHGSRVQVKMRIDDDVPLPTDVNVTIQALTIIGERNVVLSPPWKPGDSKVQDHLGADHTFVIPASRTTVPVEPDDGLKAFSDLAKAVDPNAVRSLITNSANAFDGHGQTFNDLLGSTASLTSQLASQDQQILQTARNLHLLASSVNQRSAQLGHVIDGFSQATSTLESQRDNITTLLQGANTLVDAGKSLLDEYQGQLPTDLANLGQLGLTLQHNAGTFETLISSFPQVAQSLLNAYDPKGHQVRLGVDLVQAAGGLLGPTVQIILQSPGVAQLLNQLGITDTLCTVPVLATVLGCTS